MKVMLQPKVANKLSNCIKIKKPQPPSYENPVHHVNIWKKNLVQTKGSKMPCSFFIVNSGKNAWIHNKNVL